MGANFVELRSQAIERTTINLREGMGKAIHGVDVGTAIRVLVDGAWGFVSIASTKLDNLKQGVRNACSLAKVASTFVREPIELYPVDPLEDTFKLKMREDPRETPTANKKENFVNFHNSLVKTDERIRSSTISYADITGIQYYQNSDDVQITMDKCITWARIIVSGKDKDVRAGAREEFGSPKGYWVFNEKALSEIKEKLVNRVITTLEAKPTKGGKFPAIFGPPVAGVLAHEACGHLFEADLSETSVIGTVLGKTIGSDHATIIDDGTHPDGIGGFPYDDEGTPAQRTIILNQGRVNALLTDREFAQKFTHKTANLEEKIECKPSGNARAFDYRVAPLIRQTNTYFEPGDLSWEELIEPIQFGYWLVHFRGGQASPEGTFTVGVQEAYEIVKGEVGEPVRGISISGNTLEALHKISGLEKKDSFRLYPGRCGKGQTAFTGDGGSNIRVDEITVSGEN
ncbi:MAG: metallopeptidase TldD-related protein [Candidatus Hodarchaeota archaeon]